MAQGAVTRVARAGLLALPVVILAVGAWHSRWMSDDGFINLRVVSQIQAGHGPVFNAGERVEATTSPLWVLLLTVGDIVTPLRLEWIAVLAGIGLTLAGLALAIWGAVMLQRGETPNAIWIPAGALVLAVFAPMWRFSSSGLESGLTFAWLGASLALLASWAADGSHDRRLSLWAARRARSRAAGTTGAHARVDRFHRDRAGRAVARHGVAFPARPRRRGPRAPRRVPDLPHGLLREPRPQHCVREGSRGARTGRRAPRISARP